MEHVWEHLRAQNVWVMLISMVLLVISLVALRQWGQNQRTFMKLSNPHTGFQKFWFEYTKRISNPATKVLETTHIGGQRKILRLEVSGRVCTLLVSPRQDIFMGWDPEGNSGHNLAASDDGKNLDATSPNHQ